ncbi:MAG: hypothetical protein ACFE8L_11165 [Candidatus Hodarchaeota archaeon]
MNNDWEIGIEAKELDNKHISERIKIEKSTFKKIVGALLIYLITMVVFSIFL